MTQVSQRRIITDAGPLNLVPATNDQLREISGYWPMGLVAYLDVPGTFGLVVKRGNQEVYGTILEPPDLVEEDAITVNLINRVLIAAALPYYLKKRHHGVMVPCAYYREKSPGEGESGIALFAGPDTKQRRMSRNREDVLYDDILGAGATRMVFDMLGAIGRAYKCTGLPMEPIIDIRPETCRHIGRLALYFIVVGNQVIVIRDQLDETDPVWEYVVQAGFSELSYASIGTVELPVAYCINTSRDWVELNDDLTKE